jgi:hypothetical protein
VLAATQFTEPRRHHLFFNDSSTVRSCN